MAFFFISHSSHDKKEWAEPFVRCLKKKGHDVFYDSDSILPGESFPELIARGLNRISKDDNSFFVPLISRHSDRSKWVLKECQIAESFLSQKNYPHIIPVILPHRPQRESLYLPFRDRKYIRPKTVEQLVDEVIRIPDLVAARYGDSQRAVWEFAYPYMRIPERNALVEDLLEQLRSWSRTPKDIMSWIESITIYQRMSALEHLQPPSDDVIPYLGNLLLTISERKNAPIAVFVSGFPAVGKTTTSKALSYFLGPEQAAVLHIESYLQGRSFRRKEGIQGDNPDMYDEGKIDRDLISLVIERKNVRVPAKSKGDPLEYHISIPPKPIIIVDGALNFIYDLRVKPDIKIFIEANTLQMLSLSILRDTGKLPGDRTYSLSNAVRKFRHYFKEYHRSTVYMAPQADIILQADIHHRYRVLRERHLDAGEEPSPQKSTIER